MQTLDFYGAKTVKTMQILDFYGVKTDSVIIKGLIKVVRRSIAR
jgi:hypothetical protein